MSVVLGSPSNFRWRFSNQTTPTSTPGTSVTPGTSGAEGSATQIASSANIANDVYGILFFISGGFTAAQSKMHLLDIGYDPAGGTSWTWLVNNIQCGSSGSADNGGLSFYVPLFIPSGSAVAVRIQGGNATPGTVRVWATFYGKPTRPELVPKLSKSETLGSITASRGVAVTPGVSSAEGSWTSIGTTTFPWRYILPTLQVDDSTANSAQIYMDVAYGDSTNKTIICENLQFGVPGSDERMLHHMAARVAELWQDIPSGAELWVRLSINIGTADSNYAVLLTGLG